MTTKTMRFDDFFDPYNVNHMKAYEHLCDRGCWPDGFIPTVCDIPVLWVPHIQAKMAQAWLHAMKHGDIIGIPSFDA